MYTNKIVYKTVPHERVKHSIFQICTERYTKIRFDNLSVFCTRGECITTTVAKGIIPTYYRLRGPEGRGCVVRIPERERKRRLKVLRLKRIYGITAGDGMRRNRMIAKITRNRKVEE